MMHQLAYTASVAAGATNADVTGIFDGYASLQNGHYLLPRDLYVSAGYAQGATITGAQVNAPTLRAINLPQVDPVNVAAAPGSLAPLMINPPGMFPVKATDELAFNTSNAAGGAERHVGLLWCVDKNMNIPQGDIIPVLATATIAGTANQWTPGSITLTTALPVGRYAVVGMDAVGANLIAARIVFPNGGPKPGCLARAAANVTPWHWFRMGRMGSWGEFETVSLPGIEVFGTTAPTTQTIVFDLVRIR